jgi:hypothetical protein
MKSKKKDTTPRNNSPYKSIGGRNIHENSFLINGVTLDELKGDKGRNSSNRLSNTIDDYEDAVPLETNPY